MEYLAEFSIKELRRKGIERIYFYGKSEIAKHCITSALSLGLKIDGLFDTTIKLSTDKTFHGVKVLGQDQLLRVAPGAAFIITCSHFIDVSRHLANHGASNVFDCDYLLDHCRSLSNISETTQIKIERALHALREKSIRARNKSDVSNVIIPSIDLILTEKCTLKCADCANLMPYFNKPRDSDFEVLTNSLARISALADQILELRILGGEPFIYKHIVEILEFSLRITNVKKIVVYTNATILPSSKCYELLAHSKVFVEVTNYLSASKKLDELISAFEEKGVSHMVKELPESWDDSSNIIDPDRSPEEVQSLFDSCCAKYLFTLMHGKLYRCPFSASLNALNIHDINTEGDSLNIYGSDEITREQLFDYVYNPAYTPSCNYCQGRSKVLSRVSPARQMKEKRKPFEKVNANAIRNLK